MQGASHYKQYSYNFQSCSLLGEVSHYVMKYGDRK